MSIETHPGKSPLAGPPAPNWGEIAPEGQTASAVRFVLADRVVSYPCSELRRWEHLAGTPELLTIGVGKEVVEIEGRELGAMRAALDLGKLCEVRVNYSRAGARPGLRVYRITVEPA